MSGPDKDRDPNPLKSSWFIASTAALLALVGGGIWLATGPDQAVPGSGPSAGVNMPQSTPESAPIENTTGQDSASVCGLDSADNTIPTNTIPSLPITVGDGLQVPSLDGFGPGETDGIAQCFAHTPTGAVLAAANFITWFSSMQNLPQVAEVLTAAGTDQDRLVADITAQWQGQTGSAFLIHGFTYEDRGPDNALVVLAVSSVAFPDELVAWPLPMTWENGDWKVVPPASSSWGERAIQSLQIEGFTEWRPA